ncbi:MAG: AbrB/MazE/SpoVT family DNA-binding domain-containing protein [Paenibacillaceae bacterium]
MGTALQEATGLMESKRAKVSSRRQVTIPQKFFEKLSIKEEVEFILRNGELLVRPVREHDEGFADLILEDLVNEGLTGEQLLKAFRERNAKVRPAVERLLDDVSRVAKDHKTGYDETTEIFGNVMED